ncbi:MAG: hypothetical protein R3F60_06295 [bacterium]
MSRLDQFESVFRAAAKPVYRHEARVFSHALIVTDLPAEQAAAFGERVQSFLKGINGMRFTVVDASRAPTVGDLLALMDAERPDLVCAYRNLHSSGWRWPYTLGDHVVVLTQVTEVPVLLLPRPEAEARFEDGGTDRVMAMTDHLAGDAGLVRAAASLTSPGGTLFLTHVEDEAVFDRYMGLIGKLPAVDTEVAREGLLGRMLREPADYIESVRAALAAAQVPIRVEAEVTMGHHLSVYRQLITRHAIDLLVLNTKDADQLAMHGLAYPLAVELRDVPMLLL